MNEQAEGGEEGSLLMCLQCTEISQLCPVDWKWPVKTSVAQVSESAMADSDRTIRGLLIVQ